MPPGTIGDFRVVAVHQFVSFIKKLKNQKLSTWYKLFLAGKGVKDYQLKPVVPSSPHVLVYSRDLKEGVTALQEKRKPFFTGA